MKSLAKFVGGPPGHIYFCLTKGGNAAMWKHWFLNVSIPYIAALDEHYQCKHQDGSRMRPFLRTDGEACILNQAFDDEVMAALDSASIDYLKLVPGMTPVQQNLDLGTMFRDAKSTVKSVVRNN